jgi:hypothetical protein
VLLEHKFILVFRMGRRRAFDGDAEDIRRMSSFF